MPAPHVRHHAFDADNLAKKGNSSFQEGDSILFSLVGPDLNKGDSRGIVDADLDELPTDANVTIHRAGISPSDAVPNRTDATELFNIEVDEFSRLQGIELIQPQSTQNTTDGG
jgi:hypothetical protein